MTWLALFSLFYIHQVGSTTLRNGIISAPANLTDNVMTCEEGWYSFSGKCYKVGGSNTIKKLTWEKAAKYCSDHGGSLVIIQNQETQDFLLLILLELQDSFWIGLHDREKESNYTWIDGSTVNYTNWIIGEPSGTKNEKEDCTEMNFVALRVVSGQWNDINCDVAMPFVCQKDPIKLSGTKPPLDPQFCPAENKYGYKFHNSCYNLVTEKKTWKEAEAHCQKEYSGHLIAVRDFTVDLFLNYILHDVDEEIWIGILIRAGLTQKWSSGFFVGYNGWRAGKKDFFEGTCANRFGNHQWSIEECTKKFAFVCEQTTDVPAVLTPTIKDSVCPSEPDDWRDLGGDMCYFFDVAKRISWYEANAICMFRGGSLVSFHSKQESDVLQQFVVHTQRELYLGLHRETAIINNFAWADKSNLDWMNWDHGEPNIELEMCTEFLTLTMKWNDIACDLKKGYICSINKTAPKQETVTNVTGVGKAFQEKSQNSISVGTFTAVLLCILFVIVLVGAALAFYFKRWMRRQPQRFSTGSMNALSIT